MLIHLGAARFLKIAHPLHRTYSECHERPGQVSGRLPQRVEDHPQEERRPAQKHDRRLGWQMLFHSIVIQAGRLRRSFTTIYNSFDQF